MPRIASIGPELAAVTAGRLLLSELDRLVEAKADFAFESNGHYAAGLRVSGSPLYQALFPTRHFE